MRLHLSMLSPQGRRRKAQVLSRKEDTLHKLLYHPEVAHDALRKSLRMRIPKPSDTAEYRQLTSRINEIYTFLEANPTFDPERARVLFREADQLYKQRRDFGEQLTFDMQYVHELARYATNGALLKLEVKAKKVYPPSVRASIARLLAQKSWLYQIDEVRPFLVKALGKKRAEDFIYYYQQHYRRYALPEWALDKK